MCIEKFADFPQMGRFTLRDEGTVKIPLILNLKNEKKTLEESCFTADVALGVTEAP